jgi:hypoxanthine phosphoribosyltransferase
VTVDNFKLRKNEEMSITAEQAWRVYQEADQLYSLEQLEAALDSMGEEITQILKGSDPVILCIMNGGLVPTGRLLTRLKFPLRLDYLHATRYREDTAGSDLQWLKTHNEPLQGKEVLIIDDILDEGITLAAIAEHCRKEGASRVLSAVVVEKEHGRGNGFQADFVGLTVGDRYVFGYGMDYKGYLRNVPGIFAVNN